MTPGRAAAYKLFGNSMLSSSRPACPTSSQGEEPGNLAAQCHRSLLEVQRRAAIAGRGAKMAHGDFSATFELTMARKDMRLMLEAQERAASRPPRHRARMDEVIANGYGHEDVGAVNAHEEVTTVSAIVFTRPACFQAHRPVRGSATRPPRY